MNPMINMTTHLLMLIFSRSCVKKKKQQQKGHSAIGEANKPHFFCRPGGGGRGVLGLIFARYVPLASSSPYPIIVYSVAIYRTQ